jgi:hypothetical protein
MAMKTAAGVPWPETSAMNSAGAGAGLIPGGNVEAGNLGQLRRQERALDVADNLKLAIEGFERIGKLVTEDKRACAPAEQSALPVENGNHRLLHLFARRREHAGDVDALIGLVVRQRDQRAKPVQIKMAGIVGFQARGQVIDDDRRVGVGYLAQ